MLLASLGSGCFVPRVLEVKDRSLLIQEPDQEASPLKSVNTIGMQLHVIPTLISAIL